MPAFFIEAVSVFLAQGQDRGNIRIGELVDFWNRGPRLDHTPAHGAPEWGHFFAPNRSPFAEIDRFGAGHSGRAHGRRRGLGATASEGEILEPMNVTAQVRQIDSTARFA